MNYTMNLKRKSKFYLYFVPEGLYIKKNWIYFVPEGLYIKKNWIHISKPQFLFTFIARLYECLDKTGKKFMMLRKV
jgi:hypothetical protein